MVTHHLELPALHSAEHPEHIQYRLIQTVAGERTKSGEIRLILKLKGPGQSSLESHAITLRQFPVAREHRGGVAGIHRPVAVSERRPLASGAPLRVRFADDD